ncbi:protein Z, vitamin K-dependent plasma glycoprotein b [Polymixia lowei]
MASDRRCVPALFLIVSACFLQVLSQAAVFPERQASSVFLRSKRANSFFVEEILQGNLERECYEELCSYEEARECFENTPDTIAFWTVYYDGDQCEGKPCLNRGNCTDRVGGFRCDCREPFYGPNCEMGGPEREREREIPPAAPQVITPGNRERERERERPPTAPQVITPECPVQGPAACDQFCSLTFNSFSCSCMTGYSLQQDGHTCTPTVEYPCGRAPSSITGGRDQTHRAPPICSDGRCPWQVSLVDSSGEELCEGVVLGRRSILTSAQCLFLVKGLHLHPSNIYIHTHTTVKIPIQALHIHRGFHRDRHDNDLALLQLARPLAFGPALFQLCLPSKDFSENVLMRSGQAGLTGRRQELSLTYMTLDDCRSQFNVSHPISNKMFCMKKQHGGERQNQVERHFGRRIQPGTQSRNVSEAGTSYRTGRRGRRCGLLPGSPMASEERGTVFLTGLLVSPSPQECRGDASEGLVFTKLSRYLSWIRQRLELSEQADVTPQLIHYPTPPP